MIYSKFGSQVTLVSKHQDLAGRLSLQGTAQGSDLIREYSVADLKADEGAAEIEQAIAKLPWKEVGKRSTRSLRGLL